MTPEQVREVLSRKPAEKPSPIAEPKPAAAKTPPAASNTVASSDAPGDEFKRLTLVELIARDDNPRAKINLKAPKFLTLVESVRGPKGVITPLIVRPHPKLKGKFEVLAGHRRRMAAEVAKRADVPALVKHLSDREALEVMCLENGDREDLTPLEEGRAYQLLLNDNHEIAEIVQRTGKTRGHIMRRANLLKLTAQWQDWADDTGVGADHLELIARYEKKTQDELFTELVATWSADVEKYFMGRESLKALKGKLAEKMRELSLAPWNLDDDTLDAKAGACSKCPLRCGSQPDLFEEEAKGGDRCLNEKCWRGKMTAFKERREAALRDEHPGLVKVIGKGGSAWDSTSGKRMTGVLDDYEYKKCGKNADGAVPAMVVSGEGEGGLIYVKPNNRRDGGTTQGSQKLQTAAAKQAQASQDPKACAALLKEKREGLEKRRLAWVIQKLLSVLEESERPAAAEFATPAGLLSLVVGFGTDEGARRRLKKAPEDWETKPRGMDDQTDVWQMVKPQIRQALHFMSAPHIGDDHKEGCKWLAHLLGVKLDVLKAEAEKEIPEPASWNGLKKLCDAPPAKKAAKGSKEPDKKGEQKGAKKTKAAGGGMLADRKPAEAVGKPGEGFMSRGRRAAAGMEVPAEWAAAFLEDDEDEDMDGPRPSKKPVAKKAAAKSKRGGAVVLRSLV